jgi:hypothetical protein
MMPDGLLFSFAGAYVACIDIRGNSDYPLYKSGYPIRR